MMLVDTTKCIACRACQAACKNWNGLPAESTTFTGSYENPPDYTPTTWTRLTFREHEKEDGSIQWNFGKLQCMHCTDAACVMVCPTGAMHRTPEGTVMVDPQKCIGCNYCAAACPYGVPRFDQVLGVMRKCTMCYDRTSNGLKPMCVKTCPVDALEFGDALTMQSKARARVEKLKASGVSGARLYGDDITGGTGVLYVLRDLPSRYGLPDEPGVPLYAQIWRVLFRPIRALAVVGLALGLIGNRSASKDLAKD
ncbi:MAG: 4Fe-4S dicluster domain-containing protein [Bacillota bacterium]